jgi:hypothetical protein
MDKPTRVAGLYSGPKVGETPPRHASAASAILAAIRNRLFMRWVVKP